MEIQLDKFPPGTPVLRICTECNRVLHIATVMQYSQSGEYHLSWLVSHGAQEARKQFDISHFCHLQRDLIYTGDPVFKFRRLDGADAHSPSMYSRASNCVTNDK